MRTIPEELNMFYTLLSHVDDRRKKRSFEIRLKRILKDYEKGVYGETKTVYRIQGLRSAVRKYLNEIYGKRTLIF